MASNASIVLKAHYDSWFSDRADGLDAPFVYYCAEQFLKPYDPTDEDIQHGITDGHSDGGVDAIYFIINRNDFVRDDVELGQTKPTMARLVIMQAKEARAGFGVMEINKLDLFSDDLLDLLKSATDESMIAKYHPRLLEIMQTFKDKYLMFMTGQFDLSIDYFYITKRDGVVPDSKAQDAVRRLTETVHKHMNRAELEFHCIDAQRLWEQGRIRVSKDKNLKWACQPMNAEDGIVGIVKLVDFYNFLSESDGTLAERLFDSNVRGFQQSTAVNRQIRHSLSSQDGVNFWLLNNGITIVAERMQSAGYMQITCQDPRIVNGLQSSRAIFEHFSAAGSDQHDNRSILLRLIETDNERSATK